VSAAADDSRREMIRRVRLGNLRKLLRDRCGYELPDDDAGREYLHELLLPISVGPHSAIKMPKAIEIWAPWMQPHETTQLIDRIHLTPIRHRMPTAKQLGQRLRVTNGERERLKLWTIRPYNMGNAELLRQRKAKDRARKRRLRQLRGSEPRAAWLQANSVSRQKPWETEGISRRTWYYRRRCTGPSAVRLTKAADTPVQPEPAQRLQKRPSEAAPAAKPSTTTKSEKPKRQEAVLLTQQSPDELNGTTCANPQGWWRNAKAPDEQLNVEEEK
jgi:hypothetical protein